MTSLDSRKRWLALAVVVAAQFMVVLDVAIVKVARSCSVDVSPTCSGAAGSS